MQAEFGETLGVPHRAGGFKYFWFSSLFGKNPILTHIFQMGWNHQLVIVFWKHTQQQKESENPTCSVWRTSTKSQQHRLKKLMSAADQGAKGSSERKQQAVSSPPNAPSGARGTQPGHQDTEDSGGHGKPARYAERSWQETCGRFGNTSKVATQTGCMSSKMLCRKNGKHGDGTGAGARAREKKWKKTS